MATAADVSNWRLWVRRGDAGVEILRAVTCDARAALPERLFGLPVTALGGHAFSTQPLRETEQEGAEQVLLTGGRTAPDPIWDDRRLRELTLPPELRSVGDFAFLSCRQLEMLRLHDGIRSWGGCSLRSCQQLGTVYLTRTGAGEGVSLAHIVDELTQELDVIIENGAQPLRVIFPGYEEFSEEGFISQAVHFVYQIQGAGYPYHHCMRERKLDLKAYDELWPAYLGMAYEPRTAVRLAWWRLYYPQMLSERAEAAYLGFLREHVAEAMDWLLTEGDQRGVQRLLRLAPPDRETLAAACEQARTLAEPEALAYLLQEQHRRFPAGRDKRFDL